MQILKVTVGYRIDAKDREAFLQSVENLSHERKRDGAYARCVLWAREPSLARMWWSFSWVACQSHWFVLSVCAVGKGYVSSFIPNFRCRQNRRRRSRPLGSRGRSLKTNCQVARQVDLVDCRT